VKQSSLTSIAPAPDLTEQVYRRLLGAIAEGKLQPGARVTQEDLAASLDVSRQPVLQALRLLKKDGFLIDAGRRGLMVTPLDGEAIRSLYEIRSALDGLAARLAARRRAKIDRRVIEQGRRAAAGQRVGAMIDADMAFHEAVYAASGNPLIADAAHRHWHHIRRAMGATLQAAAMRESIWDEHAAMLAAIAAGSEDKAERLARAHCEAAGENLAARLTRHLRAAS
jgi:DNA-binding GntR family transcriptional regulator